jgi:hypothetical protein
MILQIFDKHHLEVVNATRFESLHFHLDNFCDLGEIFLARSTFASDC